MKSWQEIIQTSEEMIAFWKNIINEKEILISPIQKEYDEISVKWERLSEQMNKEHEEYRELNSGFVHMAKKLKMADDHTRKIERLNKMADAFLPEMSRIRNYLTPLKNSKDQAEMNLKESEIILENAIEGYEWEFDYSKMMNEIYTVGTSQYYD